jgi:hypothetical protein
MERVATGDQLGRTLWGLGHAAAYGLDAAMRASAAALFEKGLPHWSAQTGGPMEHAYAVQGMHLFLKAHPDHPGVAQKLRTCADLIVNRLPPNKDDSWQWPHETVTYDSARVPLALLLAYESTADVRYQMAGLRVLTFLSATNFPGNGSELHIIGNSGWYQRGKEVAQFDQQPIDASSLVEACSAAWRITRDPVWRGRGQVAFGWFLGKNAHRIPLYDATAGGCQDALGSGGANVNQGGESTVSFWIARCEAAALENL